MADEGREFKAIDVSKSVIKVISHVVESCVFKGLIGFLLPVINKLSKSIDKGRFGM